jgi:hypothetical protein
MKIIGYQFFLNRIGISDETISIISNCIKLIFTFESILLYEGWQYKKLALERCNSDCLSNWLSLVVFRFTYKILIIIIAAAANLSDL